MVEQPEQNAPQTPSPQTPGSRSPSNTPANRGIVYILSNPAMQDYVKIGRTQGTSSADVRRRMKELDTTGVPRAFECEYASLVENHQAVESALHTAFGGYRVRENREFFEDLQSFRVKAILKLFEIQDVTPTGVSELQGEGPEKPIKRPNLRFSMLDIPIGASLQWVDDPEVQCVVAGDKHVTYSDQRWALSPLTQMLKDSGHPVAGAFFWLYEGETLQERRNRLERQDSADNE